MLVKFFKEIKTTKETKNKVIREVGGLASILTRGPGGRLAEGFQSTHKNGRPRGN